MNRLIVNGLVSVRTHELLSILAIIMPTEQDLVIVVRREEAGKVDLLAPAYVALIIAIHAIVLIVTLEVYLSADAAAHHVVPRPNELVDVGARLRHQSRPTVQSPVNLIGDTLDEDFVDRVVLGYHAHGFDDLADTYARRVVLVEEDVVHVARLASVLVSLAIHAVDSDVLGFQPHQLLLFFVHQLVLVEEADELALSRLEHDLAGELVHAEPLHDVEDVDLQVELLERVLLEPVLALRLHTTAQAALVSKLAQHEATAELVGKELPVDDGALKPRSVVQFVVLHGSQQVLARLRFAIPLRDCIQDRLSFG